MIKLVTKKGFEKQINCLLNGNKYGIKYLAVGDGYGSIPTPTEDDTALVHEVWRGEISEVINNAPIFTAIAYIPETVGDFIIRELGLFDENNNLLFVSQMDETPKKATSSGLVKQICVKAIFELQNGLSAIIIDPSTVTASTNFVEENFQKLEAKGQANGYASLDNEGKVPKEQLPEIKNGTSLPLGSTIILDRILPFEESQGLALQGTYVYKTAVAGSRYGYPDFYQKCVDEKNAGTPTQTTLGGSTITTYNNANGHIFYDIADKTVVDAFFNTMGIADMYGVDTENERIFLPRNNWFMQLTTDTSKVNQFNKAGLPNITGNLSVSIRNTPTTSEGALANTSRSTAYGGSGATAATEITSIILDASKSNAIYGNSNTVQPPSSNKLLYYVVGNTVSDTSWIDIVTDVNGAVADIVQEGDTQVARINAAGNNYDNLTYKNISNCLLEVPQRIKYTLENGVLTIKAGTEVIVPNGFEADGVTPKFDYVTLNSDLQKSQMANTGLTMIYYNNNNNTLDYQALDHNFSGDTAPAFVGNYAKWYDTANNIMKATSDGGTTWINGYSLPLMTVTPNSTVNTTIDTVNQVFNGFGYIGSAVWVDKDVKGLIPNGRNNDGTLNNIVYTVPTLKTESLSVNQSFVLGIGTGVFQSAFYVEQEEAPTSNYTLWYKPSTNEMYRRSGAGNISKNPVFVGLQVTVGANSITELKVKEPFRAADLQNVVDLTNTEWAAGACMPDYTTAVSVTASPFTAQYKGWLVGTINNSGTPEAQAYINNCLIAREATDYADIQILMDTGDIFTTNGKSFQLSFCALKGANND